MLINLILNTGAGFVAFAVPLAVALIGGAWAWSRIHRQPMSERPDLPRGRSLAVALGILAGLAGAGFFAFGAAIGSAWAGGINYLLVLGFGALGALAGPAIWLTGLFGYAAIARLRPSRNAAAGAIIGPVLLIAAIGLGELTIEASMNADANARMADQQAHEEAWRLASASLHASIEDVEMDLVDFQDVDTGAQRTGIERARLTLVLRADVELPLANEEGTEDGRIDLMPTEPALRGCVLTAWVTGLDASIPAGTELRLPMTVNVPEGCESQPAPGPFDVSLSLWTSADGFSGGYSVSFPLTIPG